MIPGIDSAVLSVLINGQTIIIPDKYRQLCEIWTRVMGYYRPVSDFNIGKKQEHRERKMYSEGKT